MMARERVILAGVDAEILLMEGDPESSAVGLHAWGGGRQTCIDAPHFKDGAMRQ